MAPRAFQEAEESFELHRREISSDEEFEPEEVYVDGGQEEEEEELLQENGPLSVVSKQVALSDKDLETLHLLQMKLLKLTDVVSEKCSEYIDKYEEQKQKLEEAESDEEQERAQLRHNIGKAFPRSS